MQKAAKSAITEGDVLLFVTDVDKGTIPAQEIIDKANNAEIPLMVAVNKIDLLKSEVILVHCFQ